MRGWGADPPVTGKTANPRKPRTGAVVVLNATEVTGSRLVARKATFVAVVA
jgi:hypothetical protein